MHPAAGATFPMITRSNPNQRQVLGHDARIIMQS